MQLVEREFTQLYAGDVAAVHMVYLCPDLEALVKEYDKLTNQLLDLLDGYTSLKRRGKPMKRKTVQAQPPSCCAAVPLRELVVQLVS